MAQINTVANMNGKGRDDLTDIKILEAAENIPNLLLVGQANSVQVLAGKPQVANGIKWTEHRPGKAPPLLC